MAENFPNLEMETDIQVQKGQMKTEPQQDRLELKYQKIKLER